MSITKDDLSALTELSFPMPADMLLRAAPGGDGRTLEGYVVPWNVPAPVVRPIRGMESYARGALTKTWRDRGPNAIVPLLGGAHPDLGPERPIGRMVSSHDDERGQFAAFRLFDTDAAREAAELVREGVWGGLSIGAYGVPARTKVSHDAKGNATIVRSEVILDHVALLRRPAFVDARVMALRAQEDAAAQGEAVDPEELRRRVEERRAKYAAFLTPAG